MEINFNSPLEAATKRSYILKRYPENKDPNLRAWDAADELILSELNSFSLTDSKILLINDSFGALATTLSEFNIQSYSDSYISHRATLENLQSNDLSQLQLYKDLDDLKDKYDLIIIKLPKNLSYLEDILALINPLMSDGAQLICGGMIKHMPKGAFDLIQKYIGETSTSLAKKKARLIFAKRERHIQASPFPNQLKVEGLEDTLTNHSNLFSSEKLDIGTRFFLQNIPNNLTGNILDLGCANGVIGIKAKLLNPSAHIIFADESYMAIKSAKENFKKFFEGSEASYIWSNCYEDSDLDKVDTVLCNPPFHQGNTVGDFIAWQMFHDALHALNPGGLLRVIGNRHLGYHVKMKKIFKNSELINQNKKFVIIDSHKN
jgi:16S rRNA G1207 methylase RsmC